MTEYSEKYKEWMEKMPQEESLEEPKEEIKEVKPLNQFEEANQVLEEWEKETWSDENGS